MNSLQTRIRQGACAAGVATLLGACAVGPDFVRPAAPDATRYTRKPLPESTVAADGRAQHFSPQSTLAADWWTLFRSPQIDAVVRRALVNNPTLDAAEASLRRSQDNLRAGHGIFFPQASAGLDARRERAAPSQAGAQTSGSVFNLITLSGTISYALDVFGGERRTVEGLQAQVDYQGYAREAAYLALSANVVDTCIAHAAYDAQIRATTRLIALENEQLHAIEAQVRSGTQGYVNVLSMRSLIAANRATLAPLRQKADQAADLLAALEGVTPSEAAPPEIDLAKLSLPADLPLSLPSDLVRQRPDILQAEAQLHAASAGIGVATAAMFPSFSLNGTYGAAASKAGNLTEAGSRFWSIGPSATVPLFQGGSLWYGRRAALDAYAQAQANYRQTVLGAFAQVADSLHALEHDAEALQAQAEARRVAGEALRLLREEDRAGLVAYVDVLTADVQFHQADIAYVQAVAQRHQDTVTLFAALGGGWWNDQAVPGGGDTP